MMTPRRSDFIHIPGLEIIFSDVNLAKNFFSIVRELIIYKDFVTVEKMISILSFYESAIKTDYYWDLSQYPMDYGWIDNPVEKAIYTSQNEVHLKMKAPMNLDFEED